MSLARLLIYRRPADYPKQLDILQLDATTTSKDSLPQNSIHSTSAPSSDVHRPSRVRPPSRASLIKLAQPSSNLPPVTEATPPPSPPSAPKVSARTSYPASPPAPATPPTPGRCTRTPPPRASSRTAARASPSTTAPAPSPCCGRPWCG